MSTILVMKKIYIFFYFWLESNYVFISYQKLPLVFSLKNTPYFNFLTKDLLASEALHIVCIENIAKPLWILHQISKFYLNLV